MNYHTRAGDEAEVLFRRLLSISERVHLALDGHDAEGVLQAVKERESVVRRIEPLLRALLEARANLAGGSNSPANAADIDTVLAGISRIACRVQAADAHIAERLVAERERIAGEIERMERARATAEPVARDDRTHLNRIGRTG